MNRNLKGKSYNEVMNEWAAQKHFLKRAAGGMMRPGAEVTGGARIRGWIIRFIMFITIPVLLYMGVLRFHGRSGEFANQLAAETKKFLDAEKVHFNRSRWDMNGELRIEKMEITGKPHNIFSKIDIDNLSTEIPLPRAFRSAWELDRIETSGCKIALRPGSIARRAEVAREPEMLTAGWGLSPDFSKLKIDSYHCNSLNLSWATAPSTSGEVIGAKADLDPSEGGWKLVLVNGVFRQCWLSNLRITRAEVSIGANQAEITRGDFTFPGGGSGSLSGGFTLGEQPEVNALVKLENIPLQQFTSDYFANFVKATGNGTVKITGSTNRTNGLLLDASLKILSGRLTGIPILHALERATNETGISAPDITGGDAHITSQGTQDAGGIVIEADSINLDCGTRLKLGITVRHERKQVLASNLDAAKAAVDAKGNTEETVALSTKGTLRIGLPPATAERLKPTIRQQFITREEQGMQWMDIPFSLDTGDFTKEAAEKMTALHVARD